MNRSLAALTAATVVLAVAAAPSQAAMTLWPTCPSPPGGDFALCEKGAFPQSITAGPDGAMWFTTARANLGRVTASGGFAQYDVPVAGSSGRLLGGVTVGPDGALWFPQYFGDGLWRGTPTIPPAFSFTPGGLADAQPRDVVLGPDGALWTAEAKSNTVGRHAPGGAFTHIALPARPPGVFVGAFAIGNGPDGRLWVARQTSIAAVTTGGAVSDYPVTGASANDVVLGPDGAEWFSAYTQDRVGRITARGATTLFDLPAGSGPSSITLGPDGALYVGLGKAASGVMRLTTSGSWTVTPLLFASQISSITTGPDGAIWFADTVASRIGRLTIGPPAGPAVISLSPSFGPAGTKVTVDGEGLKGAKSVTVGGKAASFRALGGGRLEVTIPPGSGAAPLIVTAGRDTSPPTDAATFSYSTAPGPAPPAGAAPKSAPTVILGGAKLADDGALTISVQTTTAAPFDLVAALPLSGAKARIAGRRKLEIRRAGKAKGRFQRAGRSRVRLRLGRSALRAVRRGGRRGTKVEVGVRLSLGGGQTSVGQRTYRLRLSRH